MEEKYKQVNIRLTEDVARDWKVYLAKSGLTCQEVLEKYIKQLIKEGK